MPRRPRHRLSDALTLRGRCFLAAGVALILSGVALGFRDITRIGVLVAGLPLAVLLLARRQKLSFTAYRHVAPSIVPIDQWCDVILHLENPGPATTPILMAEEQLNYALGDRPRFVIPRMAPRATHQVTYRVRSAVRGRHRLGPLGLRIKDPFELTLRLAMVRGTSELIVLPRIIDLHGASVTGGLGNEGAIPHTIALHGEDDVSVREYREGDDLRRIHWPATAKTGDLMVRQEDRPVTRRVVLILDDRAAVGAVTRSASSFEWAVTAIASIAVLVMESATSTHLVLGGINHGGIGADHLRPESALTALAVADLEEPATFAVSTQLASDAAAAGALCIAVICPMSDAEIDQFARIRPAGSAGLVLVTPVGDEAIPQADPEATAARLRERGWSAVAIAPGMSVAGAWDALQASSIGASR